jgi:hypothetical protein
MEALVAERAAQIVEMEIQIQAVEMEAQRNGMTVQVVEA